MITIRRSWDLQVAECSSNGDAATATARMHDKLHYQGYRWLDTVDVGARKVIIFSRAGDGSTELTRVITWE